MISAHDYVDDALGCRTQRLDAGANAATNTFAYNQRSEYPRTTQNPRIVAHGTMVPQ